MSIQNDGITERAREIQQARAEGFRAGVEAAALCVVGNPWPKEVSQATQAGILAARFRSLTPERAERGEGARCGCPVHSPDGILMGRCVLPTTPHETHYWTNTGQPAPPASGAPCRECGGTGDAAFDGDKMCNRCAGSGKHGTGGATP